MAFEIKVDDVTDESLTGKKKGCKVSYRKNSFDLFFFFLQEKDGSETTSLLKSETNVNDKSPKKSEPSYSYCSTNSNLDNTKINYHSQDLVISNEPKCVVPDLESSDRLQK